jgi:hypothetical protein
MRKYVLVQETSKKEFVNKCNDLLACGAEIVGGVSTVDIRTNGSMAAKICYSQAFITEDGR